MEAQTRFEAVEVGDKVEINTHKQTFTVVDKMFDGEILELEGPNGGEKSLVQNVNNPEHIAVQENGNTVGTLTEINVR